MIILAMVGYSIAVLVIFGGLIAYMMGGVKFPDEGQKRHRRRSA